MERGRGVVVRWAAFAVCCAVSAALVVVPAIGTFAAAGTHGNSVYWWSLAMIVGFVPALLLARVASLVAGGGRG